MIDDLEIKNFRPERHFVPGIRFDELSDVQAFGWEIHDENEYSFHHGKGQVGHAKEYILVRSKTLPHLAEKKALETTYNEAKVSFKYPPEGPDGVAAFLLFLCFIFPGIIYLLVKNSNRENAIQKNQDLLATMQQCVSKARSL